MRKDIRKAYGVKEEDRQLRLDELEEMMARKHEEDITAPVVITRMQVGEIDRSIWDEVDHVGHYDGSR